GGVCRGYVVRAEAEMAKLGIAREVLTKARERANLTVDEKVTVERLLGKSGGKGAVMADVAEVPLAFLQALLGDARLTPTQRAVVCMQVYGMKGRRADPEHVYNAVVSSSVEFGSTFATLGNKSPNCEWFLNGRWYPVILNIQFLQDRDHQNTGV